MGTTWGLIEAKRQEQFAQDESAEKEKQRKLASEETAEKEKRLPQRKSNVSKSKAVMPARSSIWQSRTSTGLTPRKLLCALPIP